MKNLINYILPFILSITAVGTFSQAYTWEPLGSATVNGTNGNVYAITSFNGKIIIGGQFTIGGTIPANNIAQYDPATGVWSALGSGTNGEIHALTVRGAELIAGGSFIQAGGNDAYYIARWNGTAWQPLGSGTDGEVNALTVFNGDLIAGGNFGNAGGVSVQNIAKWNGAWSDIGGGVYGGSGDNVSALTTLGTNLYAAGRFTNAGSYTTINIAGWNGTSWFAMSSNTDERLFSLGVHNGELYAGGGFTSIGGVTARYLAKWNGSSWSEVGGGVEDEVNGIASYKGDLIVSGNFRNVGPSNNPVYVDRIAKFNGSAWQRMLTGMNDRVNTVYTSGGTDTVLYAGGEFSTAGGKWAYHTAKWGNFATSTVSGRVQYSDNNDTVHSGKVKILRMDINTREIIAVDSANIINGSYTLAKVPKNDITLRVIVFPDDELSVPLPDTTYVPTYYPSAIQWINAGVIDANVNLTNINVKVQRSSIVPQNNPLAANISGYVYLNILPPFLPVLGGYPYWNGSVIYVKQDTTFIKFAVTNDLQQYSLTGLNPGTYQLTVSRLGYEIETRTVVLGAVNQDTVNFYLDTLNLIGIVNINTNIPKGFELRQNYPNPFNPVTNIEFQLPRSSMVKLVVFDMLGREVEELVNENMGAGTYKVDFDGSRLASGVYFYRLETGEFAVTKKMILVK